MIRILLADDQALLRMGFRLILDAEADIEVIGEAGDGAAAIGMTRALRPDVVLMDVRMPGTDGIQATAQVTAGFPATKVLILTTYDLDDYVFARASGWSASGFLLQGTAPHVERDARSEPSRAVTPCSPRPPPDGSSTSSCR